VRRRSKLAMKEKMYLQVRRKKRVGVIGLEKHALRVGEDLGRMIHLVNVAPTSLIIEVPVPKGDMHA